jgi:hypothetical protein
VFLDSNRRPGVVSIRALAAAAGVSDRTIRRWLVGEDRPAVECQEAISAWFSEQRKKARR